jgi:hypothetical protein
MLLLLDAALHVEYALHAPHAFSDSDAGCCDAAQSVRTHAHRAEQPQG